MRQDKYNWQGAWHSSNLPIRKWLYVKAMLPKLNQKLVFMPVDWKSRRQLNYKLISPPLKFINFRRNEKKSTNVCLIVSLARIFRTNGLIVKARQEFRKIDRNFTQTQFLIGLRFSLLIQFRGWHCTEVEYSFVTQQPWVLLSMLTIS